MLIYDISKNFVSKEFKLYTKSISILTKSVLIKAYNSISLVERYYRPFYYIYQIIIIEAPNLSKDTAL